MLVKMQLLVLRSAFPSPRGRAASVSATCQALVRPKTLTAPSSRLAAAAAWGGLRHGCAPRRRRLPRIISKAMAGDDSHGDESTLAKSDKVQPKSGVGEFLGHLLENEPYLFEEAVDAQIRILVEQAEAASKSEPKVGETALVLYQRMEEVKLAERRRAVTDIMYYSILNKFSILGVTLVEPSQLHGIVNLGPANLQALTKGVHSVEALEMVRSHLMAIMGPGMPASHSEMYTTAIKLSKLQAAQVYAASLMFGYFLRNIDKRFQLEKSSGTLRSTEETVRMLEELFNSADESDGADAIDPDLPEKGGQVAKAPSLREYIESFDQEKLVETASLLSMESVGLVQEYESVLFGNLQELQEEMMSAVGEDATSAEDLMARVAEAVDGNLVQTLTISYADERRLVLEAVAFGSFLRDSESHIELQAAVPLLTPAPRMPQQPPYQE